jgi:hypothetical protein
MAVSVAAICRTAWVADQPQVLAHGQHVSAGASCTAISLAPSFLAGTISVGFGEAHASRVQPDGVTPSVSLDRFSITVQ